MTLMFEELKTTLQQNVQTADDDIMELGALGLHLYRYGLPAGSLYLRILSDDGSVEIDRSPSITISTLGSATFFEGWVRFTFDCELAPATGYRIELCHEGGYSYQAGSFVGWCIEADATFGIETFNYADTSRSVH